MVKETCVEFEYSRMKLFKKVEGGFTWKHYLIMVGAFFAFILVVLLVVGLVNGYIGRKLAQEAEQEQFGDVVGREEHGRIVNTRYGFSFDPQEFSVTDDTAWVGPTDLSRTWAYVVGDPSHPEDTLTIVIRDADIADGWDADLAEEWRESIRRQISAERSKRIAAAEAQNEDVALISPIEEIALSGITALQFTDASRSTPQRVIYFELSGMPVSVVMPTGNSTLEQVLHSISEMSS